MNCQLIGPSLGPSKVRPWLRKISIDPAPSTSTFLLVVNRLALTAKTKSSGVSSRHFIQVSGLKLE